MFTTTSFPIKEEQASGLKCLKKLSNHTGADISMLNSNELIRINFSRVDGGVGDYNNTPTPAEFIKFETLHMIICLPPSIFLDTCSVGSVTTLT